eukprot:6470145-Amphidinium_carterae.2
MSMCPGVCMKALDERSLEQFRKLALIETGSQHIGRESWVGLCNSSVPHEGSRGPSRTPKVRQWKESRARVPIPAILQGPIP